MCSRGSASVKTSTEHCRKVAPFLFWALLWCVSLAGEAALAEIAPGELNSNVTASRLQKRWLFVWRGMHDPKEVDRMIARLPTAAAAGYNGVVFPHDVAPAKAAELKAAAKQNHLDLIAI